MARSDLPFASEFSPSQVDLSEVLDLAHKYAGDPDDFETAVRALSFEGEYNRAKLANNTNLAMQACSLIDDEINLTDIGRKLYNLRKDLPALYRELARHILLNLHGVTLAQCVQDIQAAGEKVDLVRLRECLAERGINFPRGGKHPSIMRLWLGWSLQERLDGRRHGAQVNHRRALSRPTAARSAISPACSKTTTSFQQMLRGRPRRWS